MKKNFIAFVPARKGSTAIKNKNLVKISGKRLIEYTFIELNKIKNLKTFLATDDLKIKNLSKKYNINIDYNRPKRVSMKTTPMIETLYDFHIKFKNKLYYDYVIILQPTSPLRKKNDIIKSINTVNKKKLLSLISLSPSIEHPYESVYLKKDKIKTFFPKNKKYNSRQEFDKNSYFINGAIAIIHKSLIEKKITQDKKRHSFIIMKKINSLDLNDKDELEIIKKLLKK